MIIQRVVVAVSALLKQQLTGKYVLCFFEPPVLSGFREAVADGRQLLSKRDTHPFAVTVTPFQEVTDALSADGRISATRCGPGLIHRVVSNELKITQRQKQVRLFKVGERSVDENKCMSQNSNEISR